MGQVYQPNAEWTPISIDPDNTSRVNAFLSHTRETTKIPNGVQAEHQDGGNLRAEWHRYPRVSIDISSPFTYITPGLFASLVPRLIEGPELPRHRCSTRIRLLLLMSELLTLTSGCVLTGHYEFEAIVGLSLRDHLVLGLDFFRRHHPELISRIVYEPVTPVSTHTAAQGGSDVQSLTPSNSQEGGQETIPTFPANASRYTISSVSNLPATATAASRTRVPRQTYVIRYKSPSIYLMPSPVAEQ
jgi:hypothetical protein